MGPLHLDHVAFPCFDVAATHRFYSDVVGLPLVSAQTGSGAAWDAEEYLLLVYGLPDGGAVDFFAFTGIARPPADGLPKDIRHLAIAMPTRDDVRALHARLDAAGVASWSESHDVDDVHLYVQDPNGVTLELLAIEDGARRRPRDPAGAETVLERWLDRAPRP